MTPFLGGSGRPADPNAANFFAVVVTGGSSPSGYTFAEYGNTFGGVGSRWAGRRLATAVRVGFPLVPGQTFKVDEVALARPSERSGGLQWELFKIKSCRLCIEDFCQRIDPSTGNYIGLFYVDPVTGVESFLPPKCLGGGATPVPPTVPPPPPGTCVDFPGVRRTPSLCLILKGAWYKFGGMGGSFDSSAHPSNSTGTYPIEINPGTGTGRGCVWGDWDGLQGAGSPVGENDYLATHGVVSLPTSAPFGYDPGASGVGDTGTGGFAWSTAGIQINWDTATREWLITKLPGIGAIDLFSYAVPAGVPYPYLPVTFPAQTFTDPGSGDQYHIDSATLSFGECGGLVANPALGLFPGSNPPTDFQLVTTSPADTATMTLDPSAGAWTGVTDGGGVAVNFDGAAGYPRLVIGGVVQTLDLLGAKDNLYTFAGESVAVYA